MTEGAKICEKDLSYFLKDVFIFYFMFMSDLPACTYVYYMYVQ